MIEGRNWSQDIGLAVCPLYFYGSCRWLLHLWAIVFRSYCEEYDEETTYWPKWAGGKWYIPKDIESPY